ncbi:hypothetical protein A3J19_03310 [Candidatus Daviesbacteria bacterium RIFCSPLOWO2_02_FULL_41_8]|uniref:tRNA-binding domain-containing protein n=2 Tax=Candidatus Daviesiibacteriota TaxID=1752718 RepID=A0A1F5NLM4_9BACT|nr:MAG: hypothetical protein A2871_04525 [Candidatus Daviesbacteria bacterium RIFCSPHIGHO2_01_FULL_41_23]OGE62207.1 MAG: hypothetical protein A2967_01950 [Candidatus Daviesbacteria bacterium RIFCSPLOWO2_01_FULL_41_32]OGE78581.1 MAG: hypothetical protein A3J19_03310 [Candidatus Daviesbacteria bacterium RIFCSPLOWO2_02_FULL_41_8]
MNATVTQTISFEDFAKVELKVGTILEAETVEGSEKLIKFKVDLGPIDVIPANAGIQLNESGPKMDPDIRRDDKEESGGAKNEMAEKKRDIRQILAGIKQWYKPEDLVGKQVVVVVNLEPRTMMGLESQGMMLAADGEDGPVFLTVPKVVPAGAEIR